MKVSRLSAALLAAFLWLCPLSGPTDEGSASDGMLLPERDTAESVAEYTASHDIYALTGIVTRLDYESDTVEFTLANGLVFALWFSMTSVSTSDTQGRVSSEHLRKRDRHHAGI